MGGIAFFDVDQTLLQGYSGYYATLELIRRKIIKRRRIPQAFFYKLLSSIHHGNVRRMYEIAIRDMAGAHIDDILEIGRNVFKQKLQSKLYQEALVKIADHRRQKEKIILISSGPYMIVKAVEEYIGADASFSVGPVIENNILQDRLIEPFCYEGGKLVVAQQQAEKYQLKLGDCAFYTDSVKDLLLLKAVGRPYVVNPDWRLKVAALRYQWPVFEFKALLG